MSDDPGLPALQIDDLVLAKLTAFEAVQTPGVARLHPYAMKAVAAAARRATAKLTGGEEPAETADAEVDATAVDVDHDRDSGALTLTVRVVASTQPPILGMVHEVQRRVSARVAEVAGIVPVVVVNVLDVEPPETV